MKKVTLSDSMILFIIIFFFFGQTIANVYAQTAQSNCVISKVGNPKGNQPTLPPECNSGSSGTGVSGKCGTVVEKAEQITSILKDDGKGGPNSGSGFDDLPEPPAPITDACGKTTPRSQQAGQYWCTILVIDAYHLAGLNVVPNELGANNLLDKMSSLPGFVGYKGLDTSILQKVKPGYAIGYEGHIGIVKSITIDSRGNGKIVTLEANSSAPSHTRTISGGKIIGAPTVRGFAGPK